MREDVLSDVTTSLIGHLTKTDVIESTIFCLFTQRDRVSRNCIITNGKLESSVQEKYIFERVSEGGGYTLNINRQEFSIRPKPKFKHCNALVCLCSGSWLVEFCD